MLTYVLDLQPNMSSVHQAPWDRDDVHYKVSFIRFFAHALRLERTSAVPD